MKSPVLIALDYGKWKTGIAYSIEGICLPYKTLPTKDLTREIPKIIEEKKATALIIGMPYHIDGSMSPHGQRVMAFARKLEKIIDIPIILHDERLTTSEAIIGFDEMWMKGDIDSESARLILESYIQSCL